MPFDKSVDIDKIDDDRRKRVTKSIRTINIEELKKLAEEIFHSPDDPWKQTLPLILIVMMSWAVFWIDPNTSNSQISIAVTSMLTLIAYRFAVDSQLPRLPYMTRLDIFFLTSTLLVFFSLIEVLVTTILENQKRNRLAITIDRFCRVIFPTIFLLASISIFVHPRG
jgi:hypothetical protein